MTWLKVEFADGSAARKPGEVLAGEARWTLSEPAAALQLKLTWTTDGEGATRAPVVVETRTIEAPATEGLERFEFRLPAGPWSFQGKLFRVLWYVELEESPGRSGRGDFILSPTAAALGDEGQVNISS